MAFVRESFIAKQMKKFGRKNAATVCLQLTIVKKNWFILFAYRPPSIDKEVFFDKISVSLNKILSKYDNITLAGDLNIDELGPSSNSSKNYLPNIKDIFGLTNLIKEPTCFKSQNSTLLDLILTNRPRSFMQSQNFETGLSDCHKLVCNILKTSFKKLPPKIIKYRSQKDFDQKSFFLTWIANYCKGIFKKIVMIHMKNFQNFLLIFQIITLF